MYSFLTTLGAKDILGLAYSLDLGSWRTKLSEMFVNKSEGEVCEGEEYISNRVVNIKTAVLLI